MDVTSSRTYDPNRDITPQFVNTVASWIAASGEVFVILRYLEAAGSKDYAFCRTREEFVQLIAQVPAGTDIEVFRQPKLPFRGVVTESFVTEVLDLLTGHEELMLVLENRRPGSVISEYGGFGYPETLKAELLEWVGHPVAVGPCPDFLADDNDDLISASKGGIDGPR